MKTDSIAKRIKAIRISEHLTQRDFAKAINKSEVYIGKIEAGNSLPGAETLLNISNKFNINLNWLLLGIGKMYNPDPRDNPPELPEHIKTKIHKYPELLESIEKYIKVMEEIGDYGDVKIKWTIDFESTNKKPT